MVEQGVEMKQFVQLLLATSLIALLTLACAPVTEGVVSGAAEATTEEAIDYFGIFDEDRSGDIDSAEYDENIGAFDSHSDFDELDRDGDGVVTEEEFEDFDG